MVVINVKFFERSKNAHSSTVAKERDYEKMKAAFNIKGDHSLGKAFGKD